MTTKYELLITKGPHLGQTYPLNAILITIGRDPLADIVISDPEVSRQHARLMETADGYELQDLGSTNGTFINGQRLGGEAILLQPGQQIEMGSGVSLIYRLTASSTTTPTIVDAQPKATAIVPQPLLPDDEPTDDPAPPLADPQPNPPATAGTHILAEAASQPEPPLAQLPLDEPVSSYTPPPAAPPPNTEPTNSRRRTVLIAASLLILMLGCCCAFTLFMWYIGGDWLLMQLGGLP